jgi:hypothetical protein
MPRKSRAQSITKIQLENPITPAKLMPLDFTGLSYETGQLYNADSFSPQNTALITAFRGLSEQNITAYLATNGEQSQLAIINKGPTTIHIAPPKTCSPNR